jgi:hypothetical protein
MQRAHSAPPYLADLRFMLDFCNGVARLAQWRLLHNTGNSLHFPLLAGNFGFRDGFARDCPLQRRVSCEPDFPCSRCRVRPSRVHEIEAGLIANAVQRLPVRILPDKTSSRANVAIDSSKQTALSARRACAKSVVRLPIRSSMNSAWRVSVRTSLWSHRRHLTEGSPRPGTMQSNM